MVAVIRSFDVDDEEKIGAQLGEVARRRDTEDRIGGKRKMQKMFNASANGPQF